MEAHLIIYIYGSPPLAGIHGSPPLAASLHHLCRQSDRKSPPKEKSPPLAVLPVLEDGSPPLAVLNTFEAAKDHFQHYKPTFGTIKGKAHLWQSLRHITPGQAPSRARAGLPSVAAVSRRWQEALFEFWTRKFGLDFGRFLRLIRYLYIN